MRGANQSRRGFTLVTISILLLAASLAMVAMLPSTRSKLSSDNASQGRLTDVMFALRQYQAANAMLPCPADASQPIGGVSYGVAAANGGAATNCTGGAPTANYVDATNHVAIGMVPVRALQLSNDAALDGYGHDITYAVDTNATGCWATTSLTGQITVTDNGTPANTVVALVSHGLDGHGAWIPMPGAPPATAVQLNAGSTDTDQLTNAHVDSSFNPTATLTNFVNKPVTSTFDDLVVYKNPQYTMNTLPLAVAVTLNGVTGPANATYSAGNVLSFTAVYSKPVTVTGTPYLSLSAITGSIGTGNVAHATYQSGSGTTSLTFSYTVAAADSAPTGITLASPIVLNGGAISPCAPTAFTPPNLSGVIIQTYIYVADSENQRVEVFNISGTYQSKFGSWGSGNGHFAASNTIAIDPSGNIWVLDNGNNRIEKFNSSGTFQNQIPCASGACATSSANGQFSNPQYIRFDTSGNLWVADSGNNRVEEFNGSGTWLQSIGGPSPYTCETTPAGSVPACAAGTGNGQFHGPSGVAFDGSGNLWVADFANERLQKFNPSSGTYITKFGSSGTANGKFEGPNSVAIDASGNLWVADYPNDRVEEFTSAGSFIRSIGGPSPYTCETTPAGSQPSCAAGSGSGQFNGPNDIAIDGSGNVWVADMSNDRVQEFNSSGTYLMSIGTGYQGAGGTIGTSGAGNGQLYWPAGVYISR